MGIFGYCYFVMICCYSYNPFTIMTSTCTYYTKVACKYCWSIYCSGGGAPSPVWEVLHGIKSIWWRHPGLKSSPSSSQLWNLLLLPYKAHQSIVAKSLPWNFIGVRWSHSLLDEMCSWSFSLPTRKVPLNWWLPARDLWHSSQWRKWAIMELRAIVRDNEH